MTEISAAVLYSTPPAAPIAGFTSASIATPVAALSLLDADRDFNCWLRFDVDLDF
jgi:hypothetical protein